MLHQVGVSFDLYYDARKHKIKILYVIVTINWNVKEISTERTALRLINSNMQNVKHLK